MKDAMYCHTTIIREGGEERQKTQLCEANGGLMDRLDYRISRNQKELAKDRLKRELAKDRLKN
jgi:hypothetical protein